jgi:spore germination cell wall hydrolase CwlJ-like protein
MAIGTLSSQSALSQHLMRALRPRRLPILAAFAVDIVTLVLAAAWLGGAWPHPAPSEPAHPRAAVTRPAIPGAASPSLAAEALPSALEPLTPEQAQQINAAVPISNLPNPPADPFRLATASSADRAAAETCLTMAVYYEVGNQSDQSQAAVAQVVLNRLRHPLFPKTVCGVVFEGSTLPTGCAFTFTCDGSLRRRPDPALWRRAGQVAERALDGYVEPSVGEATHFHADYVVPYWQSSLIKVAQIGPVIFYRWPGPLGMRVSFHGQYAGLEQAPPPILGFDDGFRTTGVPTANVVQAPPVLAAAAGDPVAPRAAPIQVAAVPAQKLIIATKITPLPDTRGRNSEGPNPRLPIPSSW